MELTQYNKTRKRRVLQRCGVNCITLACSLEGRYKREGIVYSWLCMLSCALKTAKS